MGLAPAPRVVTVAHEAPLVVLRNDPGLLPELLRRLGIDVPPFCSAEIAESELTQAVAAELRADLVVELRAASPLREPVMGLVVEVQRGRDDDKRWSWPLYTAALRARMRCPTALVVLATDAATARWAATPIADLQPGSPFVPLVLGPDTVPRLTPQQAARHPWLAVLSAVMHGNGAGGTATVLNAFGALAGMSSEHARICYDLIVGALDEAARRALEDEMQPGKYEYQSDFARRYYGEGREKGREEGREAGREEGLEEGREEGRLANARELALALAERHGPVRADLRQRVAASGDAALLGALAVDLAAAVDVPAVEARRPASGPAPAGE